MSRLSNVLRKPEEVELRGEKFMLFGLKGDKIDLFMEEDEEQTPEQIKEKMFRMIFHTLNPGIEDLTIEEVKELDIEAINFFMKKIQKLNNINPETSSAKAQDLVKKRIQNVKKVKSEQSKG